MKNSTIKQNDNSKNFRFDFFENMNVVLGWNEIDDKFQLIIKNADNKKVFELELSTDKEKDVDVVTKMKVMYKKYEEAKLK